MNYINFIIVCIFITIFQDHEEINIIIFILFCNALYVIYFIFIKICSFIYALQVRFGCFDGQLNINVHFFLLFSVKCCFIVMNIFEFQSVQYIAFEVFLTVNQGYYNEFKFMYTSVAICSYFI